MPPVGAPDTQAPQGPPPISVGSEASKIAGDTWHGSNEKQLDQNVPAASEQLAPQEAIPADTAPQVVTTPMTSAPATASASLDAATAFAPKPMETADTPPAPATIAPTPTEQVTPKEEAIPTDVMPAEPGAIKVPVATTPSPTPVEATPDPMTAFAPKPLETNITPPVPATVPPSPAAPPNYPTPNWNAMENSTKAGATPISPHSEAPTPVAYDGLERSKLDAEIAGGPEMQELYEYVGLETALSKNPAATLAAAAEMARSNDKTGLKAIAPALRQAIDNITSS